MTRTPITGTSANGLSAIRSCRRPVDRRTSPTDRGRPPASSENVVMWVAASVRYRWAMTTAGRAGAAIAAIRDRRRHHASPPRSPHQMPPPRPSVTAAPMFEPVHGETGEQRRHDDHRHAAVTSAAAAGRRRATHPSRSPMNTFGRPKNRPPSSCEPTEHGVSAAGHPSAPSTTQRPSRMTPCQRRCAERPTGGRRHERDGGERVIAIRNGITVAYVRRRGGRPAAATAPAARTEIARPTPDGAETDPASSARTGSAIRLARPT